MSLWYFVNYLICEIKYVCVMTGNWWKCSVLYVAKMRNGKYSISNIMTGYSVTSMVQGSSIHFTINYFCQKWPTLLFSIMVFVGFSSCWAWICSREFSKHLLGISFSYCKALTRDYFTFFFRIIEGFFAINGRHRYIRTFSQRRIYRSLFKANISIYDEDHHFGTYIQF